MLTWYFSNKLDIYDFVGKMPEQHFSVWLFSNPGDNMLFLLKFNGARISEWHLCILLMSLSCPGGLSFLHLYILGLLRTSPHCVWQYSRILLLAGLGFDLNLIATLSPYSVILKFESDRKGCLGSPDPRIQSFCNSELEMLAHL